MQRLHDGESAAAGDDFNRATQADPSFATAHLRYSLCAFGVDPIKAREHLARAVEGRQALGEVDRVLLDAAQTWIQSEPANALGYLVKMQAAREKFPRDLDIAFFAADAAEEAGDHATALTIAGELIAADPSVAAAYFIRSVELAQSGDVDGALAAIDDCRARSTNPYTCLTQLANMDLVLGNSERLERTSEELRARDPTTGMTYLWLAYAAYTLGRPIPAVRAFLEQYIARSPEATGRALKDFYDWSLDALSGSLDRAAASAKELGSQPAAVKWDGLPARAARWGGGAAPARGRSAVAAARARDYMRRRLGLSTDPRADDGALAKDYVPRLLVAERRAGLLSAAETETQRDEWIASWSKRVGADNRPFLWLYAYAAPAETKEDALRALAEEPKYGGAPKYTRWALGDFYRGKTYLLVGRVDEAIPLLYRASRSALALSAPFDHTHANLLLGRALAGVGRKEEACAAFRVVLARWGNAKPRSVSAEEARAAVGPRGLMCP
jgi:serine/threonine-protein kinase